jgi:hypothetical protein
MSERLQELQEIQHEVITSAEVSKETRKRFWKLVRQIKRERDPNREEVRVATEIRNILFKLDRGRTYSIGPFLALETIFGILSFFLYLYGLQTPVIWMNILSWGMPEIIAVVIRFFGIFLVIAFFYPYGRLIAGKVLGIKIEAWCFDEYKEPTLKIDYETFLLASPSRRKWFFFFAGLWTLITDLIMGFIGWFIAGDILGFIIVLFFLGFYVPVLRSGTTSHGRGEMAHYNREKKIERSWKKRESRS